MRKSDEFLNLKPLKTGREGEKPKTNTHGGHMWLMGCPNPCKLEQKLECTFLKPFIQVKIK